MEIAVDKGQQANKHIVKHNWLKLNGHELIELPLPVGDYMGVVRVSVDTKKDLQEVVGNIQGKSHARFRDECILGQQNGIKLYILVEHGGNIKNLESVKDWKNPRQYLYEKKIRKEFEMPKGADFQSEVAELKAHGAKVVRGPTTGEELYKAMVTMQEKYGVEWVFCEKKETGAKIVELLRNGLNG